MERKPYIWSELFFGNEKLFQEVLQNRETVFVYDIDGILANSTKVVLKNFSEKHKVQTNASEINKWNYLTEVAEKSGLDKDVIKHVEDDWFKAEVLLAAQKFLYIRPVVEKTTNYYGPDRNFVLTSRNPNLRDSTIDWFKREFPKIKKDNIFIRDQGGVDMIHSAEYKVEILQTLAKKAPWVVFIDDSVDFIKAVLDDSIENCLVINIPQGKIMPDFRHERLIVIKRFPEEMQAMYPFLDAIERAIGGQTSIK